MAARIAIPIAMTNVVAVAIGARITIIIEKTMTVDVIMITIGLVITIYDGNTVTMTRDVMIIVRIITRTSVVVKTIARMSVVVKTIALMSVVVKTIAPKSAVVKTGTVAATINAVKGMKLVEMIIDKTVIEMRVVKKIAVWMSATIILARTRNAMTRMFVAIVKQNNERWTKKYVS